MAWYRTGTVAINNGSATVTGTGTAFVANATIGEGFLGPDGRIYEITAIASNTSLTIAPNYLGSNVTGQAYAIAPLRGRIADLIAETSTLLSSFATVRDGIGAGLFPDGSAAAPGFRFNLDQDTGFYRFQTNGLAIATAGVGRYFFNTSGQFAMGTLYSRGDLQVNSSVSGGIAAEIVLGNNAARAAGNGAQLSFRPNFDFIPSLVGAYVRGYTPEGTTGNNCFLSLGAGGAGSPVDRLVVEAGGIVRPGADNTQAFGGASFRWSTVFAGTGTINTSDERDKHWRGELNAAELRAAKRIIAELGIYQWNDAVADKGEDDARLHFGVRAQQAFAIMEDEGLDWSKYAWACYNEWDEQTEPVLDDEGAPTGATRVTLEAGDRYGIRPDQLAFWLIAAQAAMQADLEARLAVLEASA